MGLSMILFVNLELSFIIYHLAQNSHLGQKAVLSTLETTNTDTLFSFLLKNSNFSEVIECQFVRRFMPSTSREKDAYVPRHPATDGYTVVHRLLHGVRPARRECRGGRNRRNYFWGRHIFLWEHFETLSGLRLPFDTCSWPIPSAIYFFWTNSFRLKRF